MEPENEMVSKSAMSDHRTISVDLRDGRLRRTAPSAGSLPDLEGDFALALIWKDLWVTSIRRSDKVLLHGVSGKVTRGLYAVMGPSGSGKTTLLNTLACRMNPNDVKITGELRINGRGYTAGELKRCAGYVMQDDVLNGSLTVYETLMYTAKLRLPPTVSTEEREERITAVLEAMGLGHTRDTLVGTPIKKGISGGERKRLCVAQELLTKPLLLFLDEPTSGLDSMTALGLISRMRRLVDDRECTVVTTIHQPQAKIYRLFTHLLLLQKGRIVYQGAAGDAAIEHFDRRVGLPVPAHENPADHFLDIVGEPLLDDGKTSSAVDLAHRDRKLAESYMDIAPDVDINEGFHKPLLLPRDTIPWSAQFTTLFRRSLKEQWRRKGMIFVQLLQGVVIAVLIGTVFLRIGTSQTSTTRRQPVLFFCVINQGIFGALIVINSFPSERMLSLRERAAGMYHVSAYFLAKSTAETIAQLCIPVLFSITVYWLVGFQEMPGKFFIFTAFMVLTSLSATSLALMVSALARTTDMAVTILPMALEVCRLFGGFFLSPANLPNYFSWLDALSYVKYAYVGISLNELSDLDLYCKPGQLNPQGACPITRGEQTIASLGLDKLTIGKCAGILLVYIFVCRAFAYLGLRFIKW